MLNFQFQVPTQVFFGEGAEKEVGQRVKEFGGHRVLIHFGSRHSKQSGLIDRIAGYLRDEGISTVELGGVQPNPRLGLVHQGIELCRREKVDFILAVGGGSVILPKPLLWVFPMKGKSGIFLPESRRWSICFPLALW